MIPMSFHTLVVFLAVCSSVWAEAWWRVPRRDALGPTVRELKGRRAHQQCNAEDLFLLGRTLFLCTNDYATAEKVLKDCAPRLDSAAAWATLGELYYVEARMSESLPCFLNALGAEPRHPMSFLAVRQLREFEGRVPGYDDRARPVLERAWRRLSLDHFLIWNTVRERLESIYLRAGERDAATRLRRQGGYPTEWFWVGPFGKSPLLGFDEAFPPESETRQQRYYDTPRGRVRWVRSTYRREPVRPRTIRYSGTYYAKTYFYAARRSQVLLWLTGKASAKIFVNNRLVLVSDQRTAWTRRAHLLRGEIGRGWNELLLKLSRQNVAPTISVQVVSYPASLRASSLKRETPRARWKV